MKWSILPEGGADYPPRRKKAFQRKAFHKIVIILAFICAAAWSHCSGAAVPGAGELASQKKTAPRMLSSYGFNPDSTLASRIMPPPPFFLDYLRKLDGRDDYNHYALKAPERAMMERYLRALPPRFRKVLKERLVGIYFISPFMGGGLSDWVMDETGKVYAVLVINPEVFRRGLSDWLTYRERSCFRDDGSGVTVRVEADSGLSGLMYILLHEAAHIVDYAENHTPYVEHVLKSATGLKAADLPFTRGVWEEYEKPCAPANYRMRDGISFYGLSGGPKIPAGKAPELYREFIKSPFTSLYGSQSWAEDFAEAAMVYHLSKKLGGPFEIVVEKDKKEILRFSTLASPRVKSRLGYLEKMY